MRTSTKWRHFVLPVLLAIRVTAAKAQTEFDAIMMNRHQFCSGLIYSSSEWTNYWEGTLKRDNLNLGTVTTKSVMYMANYGITDRLNVMVAAPYVWTIASAGTLAPQEGLQDAAAHVKYIPYRVKRGNLKFTTFVLGGVSTPLTDYTPDFLPLSIGLGSTNLTGRLMADLNWNRWTITASAAYIRRSNISLDRNTYYDTAMHYSNEVRMPNAMQYQLRAGYRGRYLIAEALLTDWQTRGGFDMTRQNMPFPSNRMNATTAGLYVKYTLPFHTNLAFLAQGQTTLRGRNVGDASGFSAGAFYALYFKKQDPR